MRDINLVIEYYESQDDETVWKRQTCVDIANRGIAIHTASTLYRPVNVHTHGRAYRGLPELCFEIPLIIDVDNAVKIAKKITAIVAQLYVDIELNETDYLKEIGKHVNVYYKNITTVTAPDLLIYKTPYQLNTYTVQEL